MTNPRLHNNFVSGEIPAQVIAMCSHNEATYEAMVVCSFDSNTGLMLPTDVSPLENTTSITLSQSSLTGTFPSFVRHTVGGRILTIAILQIDRADSTGVGLPYGLDRAISGREHAYRPILILIPPELSTMRCAKN